MKPLLTRVCLAVACTGAYLVLAVSFRASLPGAACVASALLILVFAGFVLSRSPRAPLHRAFLLFSVALSAYILLVGLLHIATSIGIDAVRTPVAVLRNGNLLLPPTLMLFTYLFTEGRSRAFRLLIWLSLLTMVPLVALNAAGFYVTEYRRANWTYVPNNALRLYQFCFLVTTFWVFVSAAAVVNRYRQSAQRSRRAQYALFLAGWSFVAVPALMGFVTAFHRDWFPSFMGISATVFPLTLGFGIARFSMFDIRLVIRRTLPYALGTILVGLLYALCLAGLEELSSRLGSATTGTRWVVLLAVVGFGFQPILEWLQAGLDRLFFRGEAELDRFLAGASARYRAADSPRAVARMLARDAADALRLEGAFVVLGAERADAVVAAGSSAPAPQGLVGLPMPDGLVSRETVLPDEAGVFSFGGQRAPLADALGDGGVALMIAFGDPRDRGVLACRERRSHQPFSPRDRIFLSALAAQAELALAGLEAREDAESAHKLTEAVFDAMPNPVALIGPDGLVLSCNPAFERAFGAGGGQRIPPVAAEAVWDVGHLGSAREVASPHGTFLVSARELEDRDGAILVVMTDVTELRRLQDAARRKAALAELGATISAINHEIGNILSPLGYQLGRIAKAGRVEEISAPLQIARDRVAALERLGRELREFYKEPQLLLRSVRLRDVVESALADVRSGAGEAWTAPELVGLDLDVTADIQKLKQVLLNVIKNAWEAMQESPRREWAIAARVEADKAVITVRDSGTGIPADCMKRLFQPFFTTKKERGTGLGLATARRIAEAHGAGIELESDPAAGTTVTLRWPLAA